VRLSKREVILANDGNLSIPLYVEPTRTDGTLVEAQTDSQNGTLNGWIQSRSNVTKALAQLLPPTKAVKLVSRPRENNTYELFKKKQSGVESASRTLWRSVIP
jgi:hypothetical protein